jgi:hypothetical protein
MQKLTDLLTPHDKVRVLIRQGELAQHRIAKLFGIRRGPGRKTVDTEHRGARKSHEGKPEGYVKPTIRGSTDCTRRLYQESLAIPAEFKR